MTALTRQIPSPQPPVEAVVSVTDSLDVSSLQQFWSQLKEAAAKRPARLVVELAECPYLDAQAIRLLLDIHQLMWIQDGRLVLRGAKPEVTRLLALAGVLKVFTIEPAIPEQVSA